MPLTIMTGISILIHCLLTLSHTTRNFKRGGKRRKNADGDLKNGLPGVCFDGLDDCSLSAAAGYEIELDIGKEVTVH